MLEIVYLLKLVLLTPMVLITLALSCLLFFRRQGVVVAIISLALFFGLSLPAVENSIALRWEKDLPVQQQAIKQFAPQAIVVIGGGISYSKAEYGKAVDVKTGTLIRLRYAAKLAKETGLPVLVSGGKTLDLEVSEAEAMAGVLQDEFAVPVVWQEPESRNTAENARLCRDLLARQGIDKVLLVTQAYHMTRAKNEFLKAGFQVLPAPTDFFGRDGIGSFKLSAWFPEIKALQYGYYFIHEGLGILWYSLRY